MGSPKVAVDIRTYLTNTTGLSNVSIGFLAPLPINQYAVIEYSGPAGVKTHGTGSGMVLDEAHIQVLARHTSAQTALTNIMAVVDALDGLGEVTINSVVYTYITIHTRPRIIDRQEDGSCTYLVEFKTQSRR
jgi:hypothetical protein